MPRRQSKWDIPATGVATESNGKNKSATEAARERAAKLTAMLAAKGKLANHVGAPLPVMSQTTFQSSQKTEKEQDLLYAEVEVNDSPARVILCKGTTQDEINRFSGAAVSTKGRYMDAEEKKNIDKDEERPLYLYIQATTQNKIELALKRIHEIMEGKDIYGKPPSEQTSSHTRWSPYQPTISTANNSFNSNTVQITQVQNQTLPTGMHYVQDKVFVGLEQASPEFNVKEKLLGPGGSFFQHICTETGAKVFLRGKGSGFLEPTSGREAFEALHIYLSHTKQDGLSAARKLVENLIQTVNQEYQTFEQMKRGIPPGYPSHPGYLQPGYMPYSYPPGIHPPQPGYPPQPVGPPAPHYGHLLPVPPQPPIPPHRPMLPLPVYGAPPYQQAPPYSEPPMPTAPPQNVGPAPYPPSNVYPSRPDLPSAAYNGPQRSAPPENQPCPLPPPEKEPSITNINASRDQVAPPVNPQPEPHKRRFKEVPHSESQKLSQPRTSIKESSREASYLGTNKDQKFPRPDLPQQFPKKDDIASMPPPLQHSAAPISQKLQQPKMLKDFKKPLGLAKPFTPPLPPKLIIGKQQSAQKSSIPGTKKHGLPSSADNPEPKKAKKEVPKEVSSFSAIGSLVAYEGDSSEEEEEEKEEKQHKPAIKSKQDETRSTSRTKKQNLPFWAVRN